VNGSAPPSRAVVLRLKAIQAFDRWRLGRLKRRHPGLEIHPSASTNLAAARYDLAPGARLRIGAEVVTDRLAGALHFAVEAGAEMVIGERTWLRTDVGPVHMVAFAGARMTIGAEGLINGCHLSCKSALTTGRRVWIGMGSRVFDSDQHDMDEDRPEVAEPVTIGDYCWVASDVTVLRGVTIGEHSIVGTRSLVTGDIPSHTLAFGAPARPRGKVADRSSGR
jgi:carbonic anhydrase/acetyltransferase-like protein (isoleucine patch superfamily)